MSGDRQTENFNAVDQGARAAQVVDAPEPEDRIESDEDIMAAMQRQLRELEERDRKLETQLAEERKHLAEERGRRERAEDAARMADSRAAQAATTGQRTAEDARLGEVTTALDARKGQMDSLRSQYQAAFAEGDGGKMADINAQMSLVGAQITQLEAGKAQLEQRREAAASTPPQASRDQIRDQMLQGLNSRERDWVGRHPDYFDSPSFQERVQAASLYAQKMKGLSRDSDEYIKFIDQELGFAEAEPSPPPTREDRRDPPPRGRSADDTDRRMVAAPAGGSVPNVSRGTEEPVHLSREERSFARSIGMSEADYAKNKRELQQEGLIGSAANNRR